MLQETTDKTFRQDTKEGTVLVDFWAPWCGPCRMVHPVLEELDEERDDLAVVSLNVDENPQTAGEFQVLSIPTMIIFSQGVEKGRIIGAQPKSAIERDIEKSLNS